MPKPPYLFKLDGVYYFRMRVPKDLLGIHPKGVIKESLKTKDYETARLRVAEKTLHHLAAFDALRKKSTQIEAEPQEPDIPRQPLTRERAEAIVREHVETSQSLWKSRLERDGHPDSDIREEMLEGVAYELYLAKTPEDKVGQDVIGSMGKKLLQHEYVELGGSGIGFTEFGSLLRRALVEMCLRQEHALNADYSKEYFDQLFKPSPDKGMSGVTLGELAGEYKVEHAKKTKSKSNGAAKKVAQEIQLILMIFSPDMSVASIDYDATIRFRDLMNEIPSNMRKIYKELSLEAAIKAAKKDKRPGMSYETQTAYFRTFKNLLGLGVKKNYLANNPAVDLLPLAEQVPAAQKRRSFTNDELSAIFNAPIFVGCQNDGHGFAKPGDNRPRRARFWGPLIFLYSGLRPNEFCQMLLSDIKVTEKGTHYFSVSEEDPGKKLKTATSKRTPPVHPELIKMGFLGYVEDLRIKGEKRLFPELKKNKAGYYSARLSDWFSESFLNGLFTEKDKISFYSFRHNFRNALRDADAPDWVLQALGAWDKKKDVSDNYGEVHLPDKLGPWIEKVQYPDLDLTHLYLDETGNS